MHSNETSGLNPDDRETERSAEGRPAWFPTVGESHRRSRRGRSVSVLLVTVALAATAAACSSTNTVTPTTGTSTKSTIPKSAFTDHTGITSTTVSVGNVSSLLDGIFKGAAVGTEAYADYVNSHGGVNGRRILVDSSDDGYSGAPNRQETQEDIGRDFAMVGSFSLFDSFGGALLAANPQVPNVTVSLDPTTEALPNTFSVAPTSNGWILGPIVYFKKKFPNDIKHTAALIADEPSAIDKWTGEKQAMEHEGYNVVYDPTFDISTTNFNEYVVSMKSAGVKILFLEQMPENYCGCSSPGAQPTELPSRPRARWFHL